MATAALAKRKNRPDFEELSISKIATRCKLDRATTRSRLEKHGYEPINDDEKLKLYRFDAEMEAKITESNDKLSEVRVRQMTAAARKIELQVAEAEGELAPVAEFTDVIQRVFGAMHKEVVVRSPKRLAARLAKAKTAADVNKILTHDLNGIFKTLREDWRKFFPVINGNGKK